MKDKYFFKRVLMIAIGVILIAVGIHFFLLPNNLSLGGAVGLAVIVSKFITVDMGLILIGVNLVLFILGFVIIGNAFGTWTVVSSLALSGLVWLLERVYPITEPVIPGDIFLNLIVAVLLYGSGVAIVLNQSASTGGSDIISKILNKYTGLDLGKGCLITDFIITLFAGFRYGLKIGFYCLIGVIINGIVIDQVIDGMNTGKHCIIHSKHPEKVAQFLIDKGHSATLYEAVGAYSQEKRTVVEAVVATRNFIHLKNYLREIDSNVFMIVGNVHNVIGFHWQDINE